MAITKLVMPASPVPTDATNTGDWFKLMAHMTALQIFSFTKPFILTDAQGTTAPDIQQGTYIQHAGSVYIVDTADEVIAGSPADGNVYIRVEVDGDYLVATFVTDISGYTWNSVYGYMEDTANGYQLLPYLIIKSAGTVWRKYRWEVHNMSLDTKLNVIGTLSCNALTCTTIDTGLGATEVYVMNQALKTTDSPAFVDIVSNNSVASGTTIDYTGANSVVRNTTLGLTAYEKLFEYVFAYTKGTIYLTFDISTNIAGGTEDRPVYYKAVVDGNIVVESSYPYRSTVLTVTVADVPIVVGSTLQIYLYVNDAHYTSEYTGRVTNIKIKTSAIPTKILAKLAKDSEAIAFVATP